MQCQGSDPGPCLPESQHLNPQHHRQSEMSSTLAKKEKEKKKREKRPGYNCQAWIPSPRLPSSDPRCLVLTLCCSYPLSPPPHGVWSFPSLLVCVSPPRAKCVALALCVAGSWGVRGCHPVMVCRRPVLSWTFQWPPVGFVCVICRPQLLALPSIWTNHVPRGPRVPISERDLAQGMERGAG